MMNIDLLGELGVQVIHYLNNKYPHICCLDPLKIHKHFHTTSYGYNLTFNLSFNNGSISFRVEYTKNTQEIKLVSYFIVDSQKLKNNDETDYYSMFVTEGFRQKFPFLKWSLNDNNIASQSKLISGHNHGGCGLTLKYHFTHNVPIFEQAQIFGNQISFEDIKVFLKQGEEFYNLWLGDVYLKNIDRLDCVADRLVDAIYDAIDDEKSHLNMFCFTKQEMKHIHNSVLYTCRNSVNVIFDVESSSITIQLLAATIRIALKQVEIIDNGSTVKLISNKLKHKNFKSILTSEYKKDPSLFDGISFDNDFSLYNKNDEMYVIVTSTASAFND